MAEIGGDGTAVIFVAEDGGEQTITWRELDRRSNQLARVLADRGLGVGDRLAVCLRNSLEHLLAGSPAGRWGPPWSRCAGTFPTWERNRLLDVLRPARGARRRPRSTWSTTAGRRRTPRSARGDRAPRVGGVQLGLDRYAQGDRAEGPGLFMPSTSLTSSVVASYGPMSQPQLVLCPAPLYHTNGFTAFRNLLNGDPIVLMERFNASLALDLIERHRITGFIAATPMLQRLAQVPGIEDRDLSSLSWVQQGASPCPCGWVTSGSTWSGPSTSSCPTGPRRMIGIVVCRGDEWLAHPGTLGRGMGETEVAILGPEGEPLPPGEVGGIYLRTPTGPLADYVGRDVAPMDSTADGFTSVGDLGWLDEDGYLYMADRRVDMIVTGGVNVFPGRGRGCPERAPRHRRRGGGRAVATPSGGDRVHAIVQSGDPSLDADGGHRLRQGSAGALQGAEDRWSSSPASPAARP